MASTHRAGPQEALAGRYYPRSDDSVARFGRLMMTARDKRRFQTPANDGNSQTDPANEPAEDDARLLEAAVHAWQKLRCGLNSAQFADRLRDEGWHPAGPPETALIALMQRAPYCERFSLQNGLWHLAKAQKP